MGDFAGKQHPIRRDKYLYRGGSVVKSLYVIRSGSMKTVDTRGRVTGFFMAGDLVGASVISEGTYLCDAVALEHSIVCGISMERIEDITHRIPALRRHFYRVLGSEMARAYDIMRLYSGKRAGQCLATFLLELSKRFAARGYSATRFNLRAGREEIASHLGFTPEIVDGELLRLQDQQLIAIRNEVIDIRNLAALQQIAIDPQTRRFALGRKYATTVEADACTEAA